jgi:hypothetical protein
MKARKQKGQWAVPDGFISQSTAAERLGVAPNHVAYWADRGNLPEPAVHGRACRIYPAAIIEAMRQRREAGQPTPPGWWRTVDIEAIARQASPPPARRETFAERWARVRGQPA